MIEVVVDSVRVSLVSQHRVVVLKDVVSARYVPIWIGPFEAEAIAFALQGKHAPRPMTHDLLRNMISHLGAAVSHVVVTELRDDTFHARIVLVENGRQTEVDARPSDAIALAVRADAAIYVSEDVMARAGLVPEAGLDIEEQDKLAPYRDFVESLDIDLPEDEDST